MQIKNILALAIVGLYIIVTLILLVWNMTSAAGDIGMFFDQMSKANFLLGPVGFVLGYYFKKEKEK
jgi:hypothetical protein